MQAGNDPLGLKGPLPPMPPPDAKSYEEMRKKYPAMFPPTNIPRTPSAEAVVMGQKKSKLPKQSFILSIFAVAVTILLLADFLMVFLTIVGGGFLADDFCCLGTFILWICSLWVTFFAILFCSISFYRVKTGKYEFYPRAKIAFIMALVSGISWVLMNILFIFLLIIIAV
jgi:hypothetical protein